MTIGILFGFRGRILSGRSTRILLAMAVACSAMSMATLVWLLPAANQSFREELADGYGIGRRTLSKGMNEMTLSELSGRIDSYQGTAMADSRLVRELTFSYHQRWSLACATAVLALFAVGVLARRQSARWTVGLAAVGACFAYYVLLFLGRSAALGGTIPSCAGAWFPNVVFVLLSMPLLKIASSAQKIRAHPIASRKPAIELHQARLGDVLTLHLADRLSHVSATGMVSGLTNVASQGADPDRPALDRRASDREGPSEARAARPTTAS